MSTIAICVPSGDTVSTGFAYDLARMLTWTASTVELDLRLYMVQGSRLPEQRNALLQQAIDAGCTHALLLDSDMRFPKETLVHLLKQQKAFVGVNYPTRKMPIKPTALLSENTPTFSDTKEGLEPVFATGMGVVLVDCAAVKRLEQPYFSTPWSTLSLEHQGEDVYFCRKLAAAGVDILVDHDLSKYVKHTGAFDYSHVHAAALVETADGPE